MLLSTARMKVLHLVSRYRWTGRSTLASYVWECGGNHYRWAAREIKRALRPGI